MDKRFIKSVKHPVGLNTHTHTHTHTHTLQRVFILLRGTCKSAFLFLTGLVVTSI